MNSPVSGTSHLTSENIKEKLTVTFAPVFGDKSSQLVDLIALFSTAHNSREKSGDGSARGRVKKMLSSSSNSHISSGTKTSSLKSIEEEMAKIFETQFGEKSSSLIELLGLYISEISHCDRMIDIEESTRKTSPLTTLAKNDYPTVDSIPERVKEHFGGKLDDVEDATIHRFMNIYINAGEASRFAKDTRRRLSQAEVSQYNTCRFADSKSGRAREFKKVVTDWIVSLRKREAVVVPYESAFASPQIYRQTFGYIDNSGACVKNFTLSSELFKYPTSSNEDFNCNMASTTCGNQFLHCRSGKSDNCSKLLKMIQFNIIASWESENRPGFSNRGGEKPLFRLSLFSAQDCHPLIGAMKILEKELPCDENTSLKRIQQSIEEIWGGSSFREVKVTLSDESSLVVEVERPLFHNFVLSKSSSESGVIQEARNSSKLATLRAFDILRRKELALATAPLQPLFEEYNENVPGPSDEESVTRFFDKLSSINYQLSLCKSTEEMKLYMALQAVKVTMMDKNLQGESVLESDAPGIELFYHLYLSEVINSSLALQCKAGCDRALLMSALHTALRQYEIESGEIFDISTTSPLSNGFKKIFTFFLGKFGLPVTKMCRGNNAVKLLDKPFLQKLLGEEPKVDSIPGITLTTGS